MCLIGNNIQQIQYFILFPNYKLLCISRFVHGILEKKSFYILFTQKISPKILSSGHKELT